MRERKRLLRLLVTDVTLTRQPTGDITANVRLTGGQNHALHIPRPRTATEQHTTPPATIDLIEQLLEDHPTHEVAAILNDRHITGGWGKPFTTANLAALCRNRGLPTHADRLRATGMITTAQIASDLGVSTESIRKWYRLELITGRRIDGRGECLFHPDQKPPSPQQLHNAHTAARPTSRATTRNCQPPTPPSTPQDPPPPTAPPGIGLSTRGAV
jgi:hypothetical protein